MLNHADLSERQAGCTGIGSRQAPLAQSYPAEPTHHDLAWRIGRTWRQWNPDGASTGDAVEPTLEDAVIVATLR